MGRLETMRIIKPSSKFCTSIILGLLIVVSGCSTGIPKDALALKKDSFESRLLQTRKYQTLDEKNLLSASAAVLQDLGFNLDESETALGVIVGSKTRDATDSGQVAAAVFVALLGGGDMAIDERQMIRASLVTRPSKDEGSSLVRVTFQRVVWNTHKVVSKIEAINEAEIYQDFFSRLDKAVFLEGQKL
jgi:hypothetical protein